MIDLLYVLFGQTGTLHSYCREGTFNLTKIRRRQFNIDLLLSFRPGDPLYVYLGSEQYRIVTPDELKALAEHDLHVASLNLRTYATSNLARLDRDLAVGLYGGRKRTS